MGSGGFDAFPVHLSFGFFFLFIFDIFFELVNVYFTRTQTYFLRGFRLWFDYFVAIMIGIIFAPAQFAVLFLSRNSQEINFLLLLLLDNLLDNRRIFRALKTCFFFLWYILLILYYFYVFLRFFYLTCPSRVEFQVRFFPLL